jgi:hypothetical protein
MSMYNVIRIFFTWMSMWEGERMTTAKYLVTGASVIPRFLTALNVFSATILPLDFWKD